MTGLKRENSSKAGPYWQKSTAGKQQLQQPLKQQQQLAHQHSVSDGEADEHLFVTPTDLLCPITLGLFQDPVCNALGQVYEKAAIQRHLVQAAINGLSPTDPISNAVLPSLDLVPVFPMRSRAAQYRESTARACVQTAAAPHCSDPVRYLRRAAELLVTAGDSSSTGSGGQQQQQQQASAAPAAAAPAGAAAAGTAGNGGLSFSIPGMTLDFAKYLAAHQGSAYDALVLKYFGNELLLAGLPDAAADVFYRLLLEADDQVQQAEYLQLCLDCWTSSSSATSSTAASDGAAGNEDSSSEATTDTAPQKQQQQGDTDHQQQQDQESAAAAPPAAVVQHNPIIIGKLADFVQRQHCLSPSAIVRMLQGMSHGADLAQQLCQLLLARAAASAAAAAGPEDEAALSLPGGLGGALEVLASLVELGNVQLQQQLVVLAGQLKGLEAQVQQQHQLAGNDLVGSGRLLETAAAVSQASACGSSDAAAAAQRGGAGAGLAVVGGSGGSSSSKRRHAVAWRGGKGLDVLMGRALRGAAAGTLAVASLVGGNHPLLRVARVGPLLYLLRAGL